MELDAQIESILYFKNEPVSIQTLASLCDASMDEIKEAANSLNKKLENRGVSLIRQDNFLQLTTAPGASKMIEQIREKERNKKLTKAALETLTIVMYRGPLPKSEIDYIRGVNAGTILRKLRVRGLIEKKRDSENKRRVLYQPTTEALQHLGVEAKEELPEYDNVEGQIDDFLKQNEDDEDTNPFQ